MRARKRACVCVCTTIDLQKRNSYFSSAKERLKLDFERSFLPGFQVFVFLLRSQWLRAGMGRKTNSFSFCSFSMYLGRIYMHMKITFNCYGSRLFFQSRRGKLTSNFHSFCPARYIVSPIKSVNISFDTMFDCSPRRDTIIHFKSGLNKNVIK